MHGDGRDRRGDLRARGRGERQGRKEKTANRMGEHGRRLAPAIASILGLDVAFDEMRPSGRSTAGGAKLLLDCRVGYGKRARRKDALPRRRRAITVARQLAEGARAERPERGRVSAPNSMNSGLERTIDEFPDHARGRCGARNELGARRWGGAGAEPVGEASRAALPLERLSPRPARSSKSPLRSTSFPRSRSGSNCAARSRRPVVRLAKRCAILRRRPTRLRWSACRSSNFRARKRRSCAS